MTPSTKTTLKLTDEDTRQAALERLRTYFPLQVSGYECNPETVFDVLVKAAITRQTIETVCQNLAEMVDGGTIVVGADLWRPSPQGDHPFLSGGHRLCHF